LKHKGTIPPALLYFTVCAVLVWAIALVARANLITMGILH